MGKENVKGVVNTKKGKVGSGGGGSAKKSQGEPIKASKETEAKISALVKEGSVTAMAAAIAPPLEATDDAKMWVLGGVVESGGRGLEAHAVAGAGGVLKALGSKKAGPRKAAEAAWAALTARLAPSSAPRELAALFSAAEAEMPWQTRTAALRRISALCSTAPQEVAACLPQVIPAVTACLWDTKKEVSAAATEALREAFELSGNRDIESLLPSLASAARHPDEVPECVHALAATTFVQSVDAPTLAVVVPLLSRALSDRSAGATALKRLAALTICNMSKLVDDPRDAAPFLPKLLPGLAKLADELADPEARSVCERSVELMQRLERRCAGAADADAIVAVVRTALQPATAEPLVLAHTAAVGAALVGRKCFDPDAWTQALEPVLAPWATKGADVAALVDAARLAAKDKAALPDDEAEVEVEDNAEELCNCTFTLAYGSKILLHNTQLKLKRGYKYGLLGGNDSGKSAFS